MNKKVKIYELWTFWLPLARNNHYFYKSNFIIKIFEKIHGYETVSFGELEIRKQINSYRLQKFLYD